jgi:CubicO group peptidase (beta-lactamase class C family)
MPNGRAIQAAIEQTAQGTAPMSIIKLQATVLLLALLAIPTAHAQARGDLQARLAAMEAVIEQQRTTLKVPGASLAIVKNGKVVYARGLGLRNVEKALPVTPDTIFAIASSTKPFTSLLLAMAVDERKLSFDDPPRKFIPAFKIQDPDIDARITVRDLLSHRSGVERTDLVWLINQLSREQLIEGVAHLKPTARLGERFQYQNLMFVVAGEIAARALGGTYEGQIEKRIFTPLGMRATSFAAPAASAPDVSLGYTASPTGPKLTERIDTGTIAATGGINSNARDMAQWVRFLLNDTRKGFKRLVSRRNFAELTKPHIKIAGPQSYGLGWFLRDWNGHKVVDHGGNVPGFEAHVGLMPDQKLGFVLLSNSTTSGFGEFVMETVWSHLVATPKPPTAGAPPLASEPSEAGAYALPGSGGDFVVRLETGTLLIASPGQPDYPLENLGGRRYRLAAPAPAGFFATFRAASHMRSGLEMFLEQPQGNIVLPKRIEKPLAGAAADLAELIMPYKAARGGQMAEIANLEGEVALIVSGQPAYPLTATAKDTFALGGLPKEAVLTLARDGEARIAGFMLKQPDGSLEFIATAPLPADIAVDELRTRAIAAAGGEAALRAPTTFAATVEAEIVGQGLTGKGMLYKQAPASLAVEFTIFALGQPTQKVRQYFDGTAGGVSSDGAAAKPYSAKRVEQVALEAAFGELLRWPELYSDVRVTSRQRAGDDLWHVVVKTQANGVQVTDYYSARTFLLMRHDSLEWSDDADKNLPTTTLYQDYRRVGGVMVAHTEMESGGALPWDRITRLSDPTWNAPIPPGTFAAK